MYVALQYWSACRVCTSFLLMHTQPKALHGAHWQRKTNNRGQHEQVRLLPGAGVRTESSCTRNTPSAVPRSRGAAGAAGAAAGASGGTYGGAPTAGAWNAGADSPDGTPTGARAAPTGSAAAAATDAAGAAAVLALLARDAKKGCEGGPGAGSTAGATLRGTRAQPACGQQGISAKRPAASLQQPHCHQASTGRAASKTGQLPRMQRAREKTQTLSAIPCSPA